MRWWVVLFSCGDSDSVSPPLVQIFTSTTCKLFFITSKKCIIKGGDYIEKIFFCSWEFALSRSVIVLFVVVSMEINRRHYFWSNLCIYYFLLGVILQVIRSYHSWNGVGSLISLAHLFLPSPITQFCLCLVSASTPAQKMCWCNLLTWPKQPPPQVVFCHFSELNQFNVRSDDYWDLSL